jgi:hypothetical protein
MYSFASAICLDFFILYDVKYSGSAAHWSHQLAHNDENSIRRMGIYFHGLLKALASQLELDRPWRPKVERDGEILDGL